MIVLGLFGLRFAIPNCKMLLWECIDPKPNPVFRGGELDEVDNFLLFGHLDLTKLYIGWSVFTHIEDWIGVHRFETSVASAWHPLPDQKSSLFCG